MQINRVKDTVGNVEDITELLSLNLTHQFLFFFISNHCSSINLSVIINHCNQEWYGSQVF